MSYTLPFAPEKNRNIPRLHILYAVLNQVGKAIIRINDRNDLLNKVCYMVVKHGLFCAVWIGRINHKNREVALVCACGTNSPVSYESIRFHRGVETEKNRNNRNSVYAR